MSRPRRCGFRAAALAAVPLVGLVAALGPVTPAGADTPTVTITPTPPASATYPFTNGEQVTVSVGPNSLFPPGQAVNVIECADPGGNAAGLPVSDSTCDGTTIQGATELVGNDGSVSVPDYIIYSLPNSVLGEQPNWQPVCNATSPCVLYVGVDQNDFTQPKVFSAPFTVGPGTVAPVTPTPSAGSTPGTGAAQRATTGTTGGTPGGAGGHGADASDHDPAAHAGGTVAVAGHPGGLAQTGWDVVLALGLALLVLGAGAVAVVVSRRRREAGP